MGVRWGRSCVGGGGYRSWAFGRSNGCDSVMTFFAFYFTMRWIDRNLCFGDLQLSCPAHDRWWALQPLGYLHRPLNAKYGMHVSQSVCGPSNLSVPTLLALQSNHQMRALARWNSRAFHYFTDPAVNTDSYHHNPSGKISSFPWHQPGTWSNRHAEQEGNPSLETWLTWEMHCPLAAELEMRHIFSLRSHALPW